MINETRQLDRLKHCLRMTLYLLSVSETHDPVRTSEEVALNIENIRVLLEEIDLPRVRRSASEFEGVILKKCPFCGIIPPMDDPDTIHPLTRDHRLWVLNCPETAGGCAAEVIGVTPAECFEKWNRRV